MNCQNIFVIFKENMNENKKKDKKKAICFNMNNFLFLKKYIIIKHLFLKLIRLTFLNNRKIKSISKNVRVIIQIFHKKIRKLS